MKKQLSALFILTLIPITGLTQQPGISQEQMQQLMQQAQQMQACMSRVDQSAMMEMGQKAQAVEAKIKSLCQAGKRDEALDTAIAFGRKMADDENIRIARECGKMAQKMLPDFKFPTSKAEAEAQNSHICDAYAQ